MSKKLNVTHVNRQSKQSARNIDSQMTEDQLEEFDADNNAKGLAADLVLVYPVETVEMLHAKAGEGVDPAPSRLGRIVQTIQRVKVKTEVDNEVIERLEKRHDERAKMIVKLKQAGLTVLLSKSQDEKRMFVKVSAALERLKKEAKRQQIEMLVDPKVADTDMGLSVGAKKSVVDIVLEKTGVTGVLSTLLELIFGVEERRVYRDFDPDESNDFMRKKGRLFSSLERQRLIYTIVEGAEDAEVKGAQLDLDRLKGDKIISTFIFLHSKERDEMYMSWGAMNDAECLSAKAQFLIPDLTRLVLWLLLCFFYGLSVSGMVTSVRTFDLTCGIWLGLIILAAGFFGMLRQPIHEVWPAARVDVHFVPARSWP